jgi:hydrogenase/urease accessory protein HupE
MQIRSSAAPTAHYSVAMWLNMAVAVALTYMVSYRRSVAAQLLRPCKFRANSAKGSGLGSSSLRFGATECKRILGLRLFGLHLRTKNLPILESLISQPTIKGS